MDKLTDEELKILLYLARTRLKYESRRPKHMRHDGQESQALKVWGLNEIIEKLEEMRLAL